MSVIVGWIVSAVLSWLETFFAKQIAAHKKDLADHDKAVNQAAQDNASAAKINDGSKSDDIDKAIEDSLKHF